MADEVIGQAIIEVVVDQSKLKASVNKVKSEVASIGRASPFGQINDDLRRISSSAGKAFRALALPAGAAGISAVHKWLKSSNSEAAIMRAKLSQLNDAFVGLGGKISKTVVLGKDMGGWVDALASKLRSLNQHEVDRLVKGFVAASAAVAGLKAASAIGGLGKGLAGASHWLLPASAGANIASDVVSTGLSGYSAFRNVKSSRVVASAVESLRSRPPVGFLMYPQAQRGAGNAASAAASTAASAAAAATGISRLGAPLGTLAASLSKASAYALPLAAIAVTLPKLMGNYADAMAKVREGLANAMPERLKQAASWYSGKRTALRDYFTGGASGMDVLMGRADLLNPFRKEKIPFGLKDVNGVNPYGQSEDARMAYNLRKDKPQAMPWVEYQRSNFLESAANAVRNRIVAYKDFVEEADRAVEEAAATLSQPSPGASPTLARLKRDVGMSAIAAGQMASLKGDLARKIEESDAGLKRLEAQATSYGGRTEAELMRQGGGKFGDLYAGQKAAGQALRQQYGQATQGQLSAIEAGRAAKLAMLDRAESVRSYKEAMRDFARSKADINLRGKDYAEDVARGRRVPTSVSGSVVGAAELNGAFQSSVFDSFNDRLQRQYQLDQEAVEIAREQRDRLEELKRLEERRQQAQDEWQRGQEATNDLDAAVRRALVTIAESLSGGE